MVSYTIIYYLIISYIIIYHFTLSYILVYNHILSYIIPYYLILYILYYPMISYTTIYYHVLSYIIRRHDSGRLSSACKACTAPPSQFGPQGWIPWSFQGLSRLGQVMSGPVIPPQLLPYLAGAHYGVDTTQADSRLPESCQVL